MATSLGKKDILWVTPSIVIVVTKTVYTNGKGYFLKADGRRYNLTKLAAATPINGYQVEFEYV